MAAQTRMKGDLVGKEIIFCIYFEGKQSFSNTLGVSCDIKIFWNSMFLARETGRMEFSGKATGV